MVIGSALVEWRNGSIGAKQASRAAVRSSAISVNQRGNKRGPLIMSLSALFFLLWPKEGEGGAEREMLGIRALKSHILRVISFTRIE